MFVKSMFFLYCDLFFQVLLEFYSIIFLSVELLAFAKDQTNKWTFSFWLNTARSQLAQWASVWFGWIYDLLAYKDLKRQALNGYSIFNNYFNSFNNQIIY